MRTLLRRRSPEIQIAVGLIVTALAAVDMVGQPAGAAGLLTVGAGTFGAGLGLGTILGRRAASGSSKS